MEETTTMDTLTIAEDLIEAGLAEKVAKRQAHILGDFFGKLATKEDVKEEVGGLRKEIGKMEGRLNKEMGKMEMRFDGGMKELKGDLRKEIGEVKSWVKWGVLIGLTFLGGLVAILGLDKLG